MRIENLELFFEWNKGIITGFHLLLCFFFGSVRESPKSLPVFQVGCPEGQDRDGEKSPAAQRLLTTHGNGALMQQIKKIYLYTSTVH